MKRLSLFLAILLAIPILLGQPGLLAPKARAAADPVPPESSGWVLVSTAEQLAYIDQNQAEYVGRNIRLTNDIDMTGYDWIPFGGNEHGPYTGLFDGRGHRISGLDIQGDTWIAAGFFGDLAGTVRDLGVSVQLDGGQYAGGLAGILSNGGSIVRSYSQGSVASGDQGFSGTSVAGGLVGGATNSLIVGSHSTASVKSGPGANQYTGGLIGSQGAGTIRNSYATGPVTNANSGFSHTYIFSGGLAGQLVYGRVEGGYASGAVTHAGSDHLAIGGFVGTFAAGATIGHSFFDQESTGQTAGIGGDYGGAKELEGRATADMKLESNYEGWDFEGTWGIHPSVNEGYPYLQPVVLTDALPRALKDAPYSLRLEAFDGASGGLDWSASGLPAGMQVTAEGVLQGVPAQAGVFPLSVTATDTGSNSADAALTLYVDESAPNIPGLEIAPGDAFGSTKAVASPVGPDHTFAYTLGDAAGVRPLVGAALPGEAIPYTLGADIPLAAAGRYLQMYEADAEGKIRAWSSVQLDASHIQQRIRATGVSIDPAELTLTTGRPSQKLTAIVVPADATDRTVTWSTSDSSVADVDQAGNVTPVAAGTATITATTGDGSHTATATVTVLPAPPTVGTVIGTVYGAGHAPLSGATVSVDGIIGATDSLGTFALTDVAEGSRTLTVTAPGYHAHTAVVNVAAGETVDAGRIELTLIPPDPVTVGTVTGTVYGVGDAPLPGATVTVGGIGGTTDGQGSFTLTDVAEGSHTLTVTAPGYRAYTAAVNVVAGETVDAGRIRLTAAHSSEPSDGSDSSGDSNAVAPAAQPHGPNSTTELTVAINGKDVRVKAVKEQASDGRSVLRLVLDAELLKSLFADGGTVDIAVDNTDPIVKVNVPAGALQEGSEAGPDASIRIRVNGASYKLPLRVWDRVPSYATVTVSISRLTEAAGGELNAALHRQGYATLGEPIDFSLYVDGTEMTDLGGIYTERTIALDASADPGRSTVVWVDAAGRLHFVPSVFETENGETVATFYAPHNSLYTAIRSDRTFADVKGHWAREEIELLASKLVVQGMSADAFAPDRTISRAEFAAMLVRALGLVEKPGESAYSDVRPEADWYAGAVGAASEAGWIEGYEDGTFRPDALITREQLAAMLARAIRYAGELPQADVSALERFSDHADAADWAKQPAAQLLTAGLIQGVTETTFAPQEPATRAQSAVLLKRMLHALKFID
ncbi:S-layer homology domain-containing protein [Paenibacillus flagellatus]|nr:S-layer homology domain-containing protein [Paenibacillus flagellatus]